MNKIKGMLVLTILAVGLSAHAASEDSPDNVDLVLGGGLLFSSGYKDFVDDAYGSAGYADAGGEGWLDLYGGIEIRVNDQMGVLLGCDALLNGVDAVGGPLDETYANLILVPSAYGQLYFTPERTVYINGGFSLPMPATGSEYFEFENNGIGIGGNVGVELAEVIRLEAGYLYLPVTAKATASNPVYLTGAQEDYNFGGVMIRVLLAF